MNKKKWFNDVLKSRIDQFTEVLAKVKGRPLARLVMYELQKLYTDYDIVIE